MTTQAEHIKKYGTGILITWCTDKIVRDKTDDFVHDISYRVVGNNGTESHIYEGDSPVVLDKPSTLKPLSELKEEDILASVKAKLGSAKVKEIEDAVKAKFTPATTIEGSWW